MWRTFIQSLSPDSTFTSTSGPDAIFSAQQRLQLQFPTELVDLFLETNGVLGQYGLGLIWPIERVLADNLSFRNDTGFRELYMSFDNLLFFGDAGNGDQFAFSICAGVIRRGDVFAWNHENDSRSWVAPSLRKYLDWWLTGKIKL